MAKLTPEEVQKLRKKYRIKIESSKEQNPEIQRRLESLAEALGESGNDDQNINTSKNANNVNDFSFTEKRTEAVKGTLKRVFDSVLNTGDLGQKMLRGTLKTLLPRSVENKIGLNKEIQPASNLFPKNLTQPTNEIQKKVAPVADIGMLFTPSPFGKATAGSKANIFSKFVTGAGNIASDSSDIVLKTAAQTGGDIEESKKAGLFGLVGGVGAKAVAEPLLKTTLPKIANYLEKVNLRLTPVQERNLGSKLNNITKWLSDKKIVGNPEQRHQKVKSLYEETENTFQSFLKNEAKDKTVNKESLLNEINKIKDKYQSNRDVIGIERQIDGVIETIKSKFPDEIPVDRLNVLKRSTYKQAFNKTGDKVLDEVEYDIADVTKNSIENATKGLKINGKSVNEFNKEYGKIIQAEHLLKIAKSRKEIGLTGRLISLMVGSSVGSMFGPVGSAIGVAASIPAAQNIAGTFSRSLIEAGLIKGSNIPAGKIEEAILKAILPFLREDK